MKKRIAIVLLALAMLMLAACGSRAATAPSAAEMQPETQATQPTTQETQPPQTQPTEAPTQPTVPAAPLEYSGVYWRTWNEQIGGTLAVRNSYYVLNPDHTGYVIAQEVGKITWNENQVKDDLGLTYNIALTQQNGTVNMMVYEFQNNPSVYQKIAKLPAEVEAMITEYNTPKPRVSNPEITKNPTSETVTEGGNAYFVAYANNYNYVNWFIVSADHTQRIPVNNAPWNFSGVIVSGEGTTTLLLSNIPMSMNGWCVEATFIGEGGSATTTSCYINVNKAVKAPLYAVPSSGIFESSRSVQLTAAPGNSIYYELYDEIGSAHTGTVMSGDYITIPLVPNCRYVARLVAYVVGDQSNLTVCEYTMDGISAAPQPTPQPDIPGRRYSSSELELNLEPDGFGNFNANLSIYRLCNVDGTARDGGGTIWLSLVDYNGNFLGGYYENGTIEITTSDWELLPVGTTFYNVW